MVLHQVLSLVGFCKKSLFCRKTPLSFAHHPKYGFHGSLPIFCLRTTAPCVAEVRAPVTCVRAQRSSPLVTFPAYGSPHSAFAQPVPHESVRGRDSDCAQQGKEESEQMRSCLTRPTDVCWAVSPLKNKCMPLIEKGA